MEFQTNEDQREEKRQLWRRRIQDWRHSGLNQSEFCRRHGLALPQFNYWKQRCEAAPKQLRLVPIRTDLPKITEATAGVRLHAYGHLVEVGLHTSRETLEMVLDILEARACGR